MSLVATELAAQRVTHLADALQIHVPVPVRTIAVLCCDRHEEDRAVATGAAEAVGAQVVVVSTSAPAHEVRDLLQRSQPSVLLACEEGTCLWRRSGYNVVVLGDGDGVLWWRLVEARRRPPARPQEPDRTVAADRGP